MNPYQPPAQPGAIAVPAQTSILDAPMRVAGMALFVDAALSGVAAIAISPRGFAVRAIFDGIIALSLLRGDARWKRWAMLRGGIWLVFSFARLSEVGGWIDTTLSAFFLVSMVGMLYGSAGRPRVVASAVVFALYALAMGGVLALTLMASGHDG